MLLILKLSLSVMSLLKAHIQLAPKTIVENQKYTCFFLFTQRYKKCLNAFEAVFVFFVLTQFCNRIGSKIVILPLEHWSNCTLFMCSKQSLALFHTIADDMWSDYGN